jgi:hypothetical protein
VSQSTCVADPDPVRSKPFWSNLDPNPDVWNRIRIRILALINDLISIFCMCKSYINTTLGNSVTLFGSLIYFLEHI